MLVCTALVLSIGSLQAQSPQKFNYQAVVRNSAGNPLPSGTTVSFRFTLSAVSNFATIIYQETQQKTLSGNTGLVNMEVGGGTPVVGSFPAASDWAQGMMYLKTEMDAAGGSAFTEMGVTQLLSVPFAMYAASSGQATQAWSVGGNANTDSILQFIGTTDARALSLRTNNLTRLRISSNGNVGIGTVNPTHKLTVSGDALINTYTLGRGSGAITSNIVFGWNALDANTTGYDNAALGYQSLNNNTTGIGNIGLGRDALRLNTTGSRNTGLGSYALADNQTGRYNTAAGYAALGNNTLGNNNVAIGIMALNTNTTRSYLVAVGDSALFKNGLGASSSNQGVENTAVGSKALFSNTTGSSNSAFGFNSMHDNISGSFNAAFGMKCLTSNTTGFSNSVFGFEAMISNTSGSYNSAFGLRALYTNSTGSSNCAFGLTSLYGNTTGTSNSAYGYRSLYYNTTGDYNTAVGGNALFGNTIGIGNTGIGFDALANNSAGDFNLAIGYNADMISGLRYSASLGANAYVSTNRTMAFGRPDSVQHWIFGRNSYASSAYALQVGTGTANGNGAYLTTGGAWTNTSDVNLKSDITEIDGAGLLEKVKQLQITRWKYNGTEEYHIGPMAQQFYSLFAVGADDRGISTIDPSGVALRAIQEQQKQIEEMKAENAELKRRLEKLEELLNGR